MYDQALEQKAYTNAQMIAAGVDSNELTYGENIYILDNWDRKWNTSCREIAKKWYDIELYHIPYKFYEVERHI